jgi:hypothetical protein
MIDITGMKPETAPKAVGTTMCALKSESSSSRGARSALRIESVDNWHGNWNDVRELIDAQSGASKKLRVDKDGWLSARQVVMVAFVGKTPAAYLSFIVSPDKSGCVEARHVSHGCDNDFAKRGIESQLYQATVERANALGCKTLRGFKLNSKWC